MRKNLAAILTAVCVLFSNGAFADGLVWWEGEHPKETNFPKSSWFSPSGDEEKDKLSDGAWLSADDRSKGLYAVYEIDVPADGEYAFWVRKFWKHGPFRWRFDDDKWRECTKNVALADSVEIRKHLCANWVALGKVTLAKGRRSLRIELTENGAAAFDCFALTTGLFVPNGKNRPGEKTVIGDDGWFAFEPAPDEFAASPIDLSFLNEKPAGARGFIKAGADGFVYEKGGASVRFWGVNVGANMVTQDYASIDYLAERLARLGVNIVRVHSAVFDPQAADPSKIDERHLDGLFYFVAAMKKRGVYVKLSFYFPLWFRMRGDFGFAGYKKDQVPFALLFFHPKMQAIYRAWAEKLLTTESPYTGMKLADDPAVAIVEIVNEDNYFFWTFKPYETVPGEMMALIEGDFFTWLEGRFGTVEKIRAALGAAVRGDDLDGRRAGLVDMWKMLNDRKDRGRLQAAFLTGRLREFYADMTGFFRGKLGVKCAISATNWKTADDRLLGPLDKYTNMPAGVIDRHGYFGGEHKGERASYALEKGHTYTDRSALFTPERQVINEIEYVGYPHIVSEINWPMPNRFRADMPALAAAYGLLQGTDGFFFFALGTPEWSRTHSKFSIYSPVTMGQFPATALIFRRGLIREAPAVVHEHLVLTDLLEFRGALATTPLNLDELRKTDGADTDSAPAKIDPLTPFVGRITRRISEEPEKSFTRDLADFIDRKNGTVKSVTGELVWNFGEGFVTIDAPGARGVVGFLKKAGAVRLGNVEIDGQNEYGAILVVAMDAQPMAKSEKILVQVMSEDKNHGWRTKDLGNGRREIESLGGPPIVVKNLAGRVAITRNDAASFKVVALDHGGYVKTATDVQSSEKISIELAPDCLYYVLEKK